MPPEALDAYLCEQYHCPPSEVDKQDPVRILQHLTVWRIRSESDEAKSRR